MGKNPVDSLQSQTQIWPTPKDSLNNKNDKKAEQRKQQLLDYLAKFGLVGLIALNVVMLFSNQLAGVSKLLTAEKRGLQKSWPALHKALSKFNDPHRTVEGMKRWIHVVALIQLSSNFQISINTEQPNKLLASVLYAMRSVFMVIQPNKWAESLNFFGSTFWFAGERNDIENSNHPGQRRGLDLKSILYKEKSGKTRVNRKELIHARHFIADDLKYALSAKPWQEFVSNIRHPVGINVPQSYQTALGSQFNLLAFIGLIGMLCLGRKSSTKTQKIMKPLMVASQIAAAASIILPSIPLASRAWQSRRETDGILTLLGVPMAVASRVALAAPTLNAVSGIGGIGQPFIQEGKRVNSKKYQVLVKYLQSLYYQAQRNPSLTAAGTLRQLESNPETLKTLQKSMGKVRVNYLLDILRTGARQPQTPFAISLFPYTLQSEESMYATP